jgi:hypothetical protein
MRTRPSIALVVVASLHASVAAGSSKACSEQEVVGESCREFGETPGWPGKWWNQYPAIALSLGLRSASYDTTRGGAFDGNVESSSLAYHFPGSAMGAGVVRSYGLDLGALYYMVPYLYLGADVVATLGNYGAPSFHSNGLVISPSSPLNVSQWEAGGVLGARLPLGWVALRADVLLGASWLSLDQYALSGGHERTATAEAVSLLVEPRVHLDVWTRPFLTVSAFAAMPGFVPATLSGGVELTGHFRAFDGAFALF